MDVSPGQPALYDGAHALLTDLLERTLAKYAALRVLPVVSLTMERDRAAHAGAAQRESAGVIGTIVPGKTITLHATTEAHVPVTGANGRGAERYGPFAITHVDVSAGSDVTLPLAPDDCAGGGDGGGLVGATGAGAAGSGCGCETAPTTRLNGAAILLAFAAALSRPRSWLRRRGQQRSWR